ncbi:efflux RND transporter periplasmic adaptor subunit [Neisseriaceae bacterium JH1-16]|nr:efflux RND transporter periplasmic adaptor subunit [Neisseriaceae bacterium JH1-16]
MTKTLRLILVASVALLAACGKSQSAANAKPADSARELARADVLVARVAPVADSLPFTGTLSALSSSVLASQIDGTVSEVKVREGERVAAGQVLATIDSEELRQSVAEQSARFSNNESQLKLAKLKLDQQRELAGKGFISKTALDEAESAYVVKAGELAAQRSQLARARKQLSYTVVHAPIAGVVYERKINPGEQIVKNARLFAVADLSVLEIAAALPSRMISQVKPGLPARFSVEGLAERFGGTLVRINPVASTSTRSFTVYVRVQNPNGVLKGGQFVKGALVLNEVTDKVALPLAAINDRAGKPWVMVVKGGKLEKRPVALVLSSESERQAAITGVAAGETVLSAALLGIKAGDAVTLPRAS